MIRLKIKELAKERGISQLKLGRLADIDTERMRRIFRYGDSLHCNLTLTSLDRIARALGVDASALIESVPEE
jgi:transcriptional regulator with XRE-family HTH domain